MADPEFDLAFFKTSLLHLQQRTNELARQLQDAGQTVELDQNRVGRLSRSDALQSQSLARAGADRSSTTLAAIKDALRRIETGNFGFCQHCEEPIAVARLEIAPTALHCVRCASKSELA